jgi:hypothetical protein
MISDEKRQRISSIERWLKQLRGAHGRRGGGDPSIVNAIEARLKVELDPAVRRQLNLELASEYKALRKYDDAERIYLKLFQQSPEEPMPLILLAGQKLHDEDDPVTAMKVIDHALASAFHSGNFRRLALGVKARIALSEGRFRIVEDVIRQLLHIRNERRGADVGIERDFFDRLPRGAIDKTLALRYAHYARNPGTSRG